MSSQYAPSTMPRAKTKVRPRISGSTSSNHCDVLEDLAAESHAGRREAIAASRAQSRRFESSDDLAVVANARPLENENVLEADDVAFHPGDFRDVRHLSRAVRETRHLDEQIHRPRHLLFDRA